VAPLNHKEDTQFPETELRCFLTVATAT
jgi:hypothetical protein